LFGLISYKKLLEEKDKRIESLEKEIMSLKNIINPNMQNQYSILQEQNSILEGNLNTEIPYTKDKLDQMLADQAQANKMLMGDLIEV
jgi:hypothetical protein